MIHKPDAIIIHELSRVAYALNRPVAEQAEVDLIEDSATNLQCAIAFTDIILNALNQSKDEEDDDNE